MPIGALRDLGCPDLLTSGSLGSQIARLREQASDLPGHGATDIGSLLHCLVYHSYNLVEVAEVLRDWFRLILELLE